MNSTDFDGVGLGYELPSLSLPKISRRTLALYAGAAGDDNPVHIDTDFARAAGVGDVLAHGMLSMAYLGRLLTNWIPQSSIRSFNARFTALTRVGEALICRGWVVNAFERSGERFVELELSVANTNGEQKVSGGALIVLPR